ncbi:HU family DNA-binding protein [Paraburkholderia sp. UCT31]|uniref:HU family DNA-binding protein n=1 Tax=Paraburkholderia sp. UCT31 TaxID=2615209 RepID=UPI001654F2FF|nr:HU family DNA-binding protein [Paraburkholderia sp. UCT31]MBC8737104.1 HU family DNA-binding protein [Paraburkholderia sp. UCT31]
MTTKSDLIERVAARTGATKVETARAFDALVEVVTESLAANESVSLTGLGAFAVKHRAAREARNPRTGETVKVDASRSARFSVSSTLKKALN